MCIKRKLLFLSISTMIALLMVIGIFWFFYSPTLLQYNVKVNRIVIKQLSASEILSNRSNMEDLMAFVDDKPYSKGFHEIQQMFGIRGLRKTNCGYYTVVDTDSVRTFLFFDRELKLTGIMLCSTISTYSQSNCSPDSITDDTVLYEKGRYDELGIPFLHLNTGALYVSFYYDNGIELVLYNGGESFDEFGHRKLNKQESRFFPGRSAAFSFDALSVRMPYVFKRDLVSCQGNGTLDNSD